MSANAEAAQTRSRRGARRALAAVGAGLLAAALPGAPARADATDTRPEREYTIRNWQTEDGLPQNSVRCLAQTRDGFLWLGTFDGLVRFDGVRFTTFTAANVPELRSHSLNALCVDRQDTLWIGTETGGLYSHRQGRFSPVTAADGLPAETIRDVSEDAAGTLWVTAREGVFCREGVRFARPSWPAGSETGVFSVVPGQPGQVWLRTDRGPVLVEVGHLTQFPGCTNEATDLAVEASGAAWCWVRQVGLIRIRERVVTRFPELAGGPLSLMHCASDGVLWLSYHGFGLQRWRPGQPATGFRTDGLSSSAIGPFLPDREGNLWAGSSNGGLLCFRKNLFRVYSTREGMAADDVMSVCSGAEGRVWIGTVVGGLHLLQNGRARPIPWEGQTDVMTLCPEPDGSLWVGTYGRGLVRWGGEQWTQEPNPCGEIIRVLFRDRRGRLWVGSGKDGLHCLDRGRWTSYSTAEGLAHRTVTCLLEDRAGHLWIGTPRGLQRLADGRFTRFDRTHGLGVEIIQSLFEDAAGVLWVGTSGGGLARYGDGRFSSVTTRHGLVSDVIAQLLEDDQGFFWIGSNGGIMRIARAELLACAEGRLASVQCFRYGQAEGLIRAECAGSYQPTCMKGPDGRLWFCTVGGLAVVDPTQVPFNAVVPRVFVEQVTTDTGTVDLLLPGPGGPAAGTRPPAPEAPPASISVSPRNHRLEFRYTALTFTAPERARFRYRLEDWDRQWIDAGTRRVAYYPRVPPGQYRFRVVACNDSGVWSEAGATLALTVLTPWYQTTWAYFSGGLLTLGAALGLHHARLRHLHRARARQAEFSRRLIQSQEDERQRIAGELHDGLAQNLLVIKNRALLGLMPRDAPTHPTAQLEEISRLASRTLQEVRDISRDLRPYQLDRLGLTKTLEATVAGVTTATGLRCAAHFELLDGLLPAALEIHVYRIVQELLTNVVRHSDASVCRVQARRFDRRLVLTVEDDGRGFAAPGAVSADAPAKGSGLGLHSVAERVRLLGGLARCDSQPGRGTQWRIEIPLPAPAPSAGPLDPASSTAP